MRVFNRLGDVLSGLFYICLGTFLCGWGGHDLMTTTSSWSWPTAQGHVVDVDVRSDDGTASVTVKYDYSVSETQHTGKQQIYWAQANKPGSQASGIRNTAREIAKAYPKGKPVPIRYKADEPEVSVLEPGIHWHSAASLLAGVMAILGGVKSIWSKTVENSRDRPQSSAR
jgi:hypothetical protein